MARRPPGKASSSVRAPRVTTTRKAELSATGNAVSSPRIDEIFARIDALPGKPRQPKPGATPEEWKTFLRELEAFNKRPDVAPLLREMESIVTAHQPN